MAIDFKHPAVTVDAVIVKDGKIALIKRKNEPFKGCWALPGGFVDYGEKVEDAAVREALEETSLHVELLALLGVYSDPKRDPRGHTVGVIYIASVMSGELKAADDAAEAVWHDISEPVELAFDHGVIYADALKALESLGFRG